MAKFLTTSATSYYLEELIKGAERYLVLISPYIKVNDRMRELLEHKDRQQIPIKIVYGKKHQPAEISWLQDLRFVRVKFCKNLHAKCYLSEKQCIITSLNLYDFSQINNNEMGVLISRADDSDLYRETLDEAKRLLQIRNPTPPTPKSKIFDPAEKQRQKSESDGKLTSSKLARKLGFTTSELLRRLVEVGLLELQDGEHRLTAKGVRIGGEYRPHSRFGPYFLWPENAFQKPSR